MKSWSLVLVALFVVTAHADLWDNIKDGACFAGITPKLMSDCISAYNEELNDRPKGETDKKSSCCAFLRAKSCVQKITEKECGENTEEAAKSFMNRYGRSITSDDCLDYGFIACITITQMAIAGAVVLALLALLSCICCCCCRR